MINFKKCLRRISSPAGPSRRVSKSLGQGMVEFALALPVLLTVLYGVLEAGRLIFIYASTVTAARQAVRYGSTTGINEDGIPYFRDCDGIRATVQNVGFINDFDDTDIFITYDRGLDTDGDLIPIPDIDPSPIANTCNQIGDGTLRNGDRIKVQVSTDWSPIISIVPSWQGFTITSSAERTFLVSVAMSVTPMAQAWIPGGSGALQLDVAVSPATYSAPGQTITYVYTLTNAGTVNLTSPFSVLDNIAAVNCSSAPASLVPGQSLTCTGTYIITQADLDAGEVTNEATGSSLETSSNSDGATVTATWMPALTLGKSASHAIAQTQGTDITYTYTLTNTGNVSLSSPYVVSDNKINSGQMDCSSAISPLAPGASTTCTAAYALTSADVNNGSVTNYATASAKFGAQTVSSNVAHATVITAPINLTVTPSLASVNQLNQQIIYTYTLDNISSSPLTYPYTIVDDKVTNISCPSSSSFAAGENLICQGTYSVTQADLDAGGVIENHAVAYAKNGSINVSSNQAGASVAIVQTPALSVSISPSQSIVSDLNASVSYTYVVTNSGNVTLSAPFSVTDLKLGNPTCALSGSLAPQASTTCVLGYSITQGDLDRGSITNTASATAQFASQPVISTQASATVVTYNNPRLSLEITSMPQTYSSSASILNFTFTLRNSGNSLLTAPYAVSASEFLGSVNCSNAAAQLAVGEETRCSASYTTTTADVSAGAVVVVATASAMNGGAPISSNAASLTVSSAFQCFVYHRTTTTLTSSITYSSSPANKMYINLINDAASGGAIHVNQIRVFNWNYSSHNAQFIKTIKLDGITIYNGSIEERVDPMFYTGPFLTDIALDPGTSKKLEFEFNKTYIPTGNEQIRVTFIEGGCPVLDTSNQTQVK